MKLCILPLLILFILETSGQVTFNRNINIPVYSGSNLSNPWAGGLNFPVFSSIDLNNDNVLDLFIFDRSNERVLTYINNGNPGVNCWTYAPQYADQFPQLNGWAFLYDYNCDDKPDLFCDNYHNNGIFHFQNNSSGSNLQFNLQDSSGIQYFTGGTSHTNIRASAYLVPHFNDVDGDGDMDIIGQQLQCLGGFAYYKNMSIEHKGNCDSLDDFEIDHNVWGDFTLRMGTNYPVVAVGPNSSGQYNWNKNCYVSHNLDDKSFHYEVARRDDTYASIFTIDIDGDGDMEALIGDSQTNNSLLLINGGDTAHAHMVSQDTMFPVYDTPVYIHSWSAHAYLDADNDGIKDLIVSQAEWSNNHSVLLYKNIGTNSVPVFHFITNNFLQDGMIDVGESATSVFYDYDNDGLVDLFIGNKYYTTSDTTYYTSITLYRNNGTAATPSFEFITSDYAGLISFHLPGQIYPAFGDIDNDNDIDMIVGLDDGSIVKLENTAGHGNIPAYAAPVFNYCNIDVGQAAAPQLIDLNRDGFTDLIIGQKNGIIKYFQHTTNTSAPFNSVATDDSLGGIVIHSILSTDGYVAPFVFQQGSDYRMLVTSMAGEIYLYGNIDGNLTGNFTVLDTLLSVTGGSHFGNNMSVSGGNLNGDSLTDFIVGYYGGGAQIFYQGSITNSTPELNSENVVSVSLSENKIIVVKSFLNGSCAVMDMNGRIISKKEMNGGYALFDASDYPTGIYLVHFLSGKNSICKKIIITR